METDAAFMDCPAYLDGRPQARCGLPAVVEGRWAMASTDGPLPAVKIRCPRGHWFSGPVESLIWDDRASGDAGGGRMRDDARYGQATGTGRGHGPRNGGP